MKRMEVKDGKLTVREIVPQYEGYRMKEKIFYALRYPGGSGCIHAFVAL